MTPAKRSAVPLLNLLTILVLLAMLAAGGFILWIYFHPTSPLNPLPPPTLVGAEFVPTTTPEPASSQTPSLQPSDTPIPTMTPTPTPPPTVMEATPADTPTPVGSPTPAGWSYAFSLQADPELIKSTLYHPDLGCQWMGVAGQAFDIRNSPAIGIRVQVGGYLGGRDIDLNTLTGAAIAYGRSGYELKLSDVPYTSNDTLWIRLLDQQGIPLSDRITFDTSNECEHNLIIINFKQTR
ncbi:MAG TPA: hypothetical protein PKG95_02270 [Anaerolineaceae bacterium]|nr:hypothetical protein [Anaerolineaceae bacterium]